VGEERREDSRGHKLRTPPRPSPPSSSPPSLPPCTLHPPPSILFPRRVFATRSDFDFHENRELRELARRDFPIRERVFPLAAAQRGDFRDRKAHVFGKTSTSCQISRLIILPLPACVLWLRFMEEVFSCWRKCFALFHEPWMEDQQRVSNCASSRNWARSLKSLRFLL